MYGLRLDMRAPTDGPASTGELYRAAIEMAEWGDQRSCSSIMVCEHHASPDGYVPSPLVLAGAIAARTERVPIVVAALLLTLHDPIKVAEDLAVLDIISGGRVSYVIGLGYRPEEYDMFGVDFSDRGAVMDDKLTALRQALRGEPFDYHSRRVHVTPAPITPGGPRIAYGGRTRAAARRAGRLGLDMFAQGPGPGIEEAYRAAAAEAGVDPGHCLIPPAGGPTTVFVADDLDAAWARIGPHMLHDATVYRAWMGDDHTSSSRSEASTVEELRAEQGAYRIVTPDGATEIVRQRGTLPVQPLCGGLPPDIAWDTLHLIEERVVPALV